MVRVVVVNFNGSDMTLRCLDSVEALDWPPERLDVVLVDNASQDGVAGRVERERPRVRVLRNSRNLGFGGGCNAGMGRLAGVDYVALVNNDAVVEPGWLRAMAAGLDADPRAGGTSGKVLFGPAFTEVVIEAPTFVPGRGDRRRLGVRLSGVEVSGADRWGDALLQDGFWGVERGEGPERSFQWTAGRARLLVPGPRPPGGEAAPRCRLRLASASERPVTLRSGDRSVRVTVGSEPAWFDVELAGTWTDVVNSAGGALLAGGYGADRGFVEADDGRYDEPAEVFSWTGTAALLRARHLEDVGLFDDRFFLYYEDLDLSWRARLRGWRHLYVPGAVARHLHSATAGATSPLVLHHLERNRLLTLTRNAPAPLLASALADFARVTAVASAREARNSLSIGSGLATDVLRQRGEVAAGYLRLAPGSTARRRRDGRRLVVDRAELVRCWAGPR